MRALRPGLAAAALVAIAALAVTTAWAQGQPRPAAQDQGVAVIISPLEGALITGVVPIAGTANHPQFQRYELAFAYSPNPTDTWFEIQPPSPTPVVNDILGRWDTSQISDGMYALRLRVVAGDGSVLEALVLNVQVVNASPTPASSPTEGPAEAATATPPPTEPAIILPPTATLRPTAVPAQIGFSPPPVGAEPRFNAAFIRAAFLAGVRLTLIGFLLLGAYVSLRAALRARPK